MSRNQKKLLWTSNIETPSSTVYAITESWRRMVSKRKTYG
jgi:hypothetical protein